MPQKFKKVEDAIAPIYAKFNGMSPEQMAGRCPGQWPLASACS